MIRLRVSRDANADLDAIWLQIAQRDGIEAAERHIGDLTSKFAVLASMPYIGRKREELKGGVRSYVVGDYVIYYRYLKHTLTIMHVIHGARDVRKLFE